MTKADVPTRLLDAAEALFAERGYHGVSMRQIADGAGVSVSLAQYHFKAKELLFGAVMERRIMAINHKRLMRLDEVEQRSAATGKIELEDVLRAFLEPTVLLSRDKASGGAHYAQLISQVTNDPQPHARNVSRTLTDPIARQTMRVLRLALPELDQATLAWCYLFSVGAMISAISPTGRIRLLSNGEADPDDVTQILELLVPFLSGGFAQIAALRQVR
ncbi:TetR/AcrR family transcriptional regulator [Polaromonas sp. SM01]|uniref:TetR/AcrR family transcriptional regulator n=1 Tax=Polaromonas sp. SM01 TaxID=3085630 RepID=UPI002981AB6B|nr:TetR/AcrR family transcriptional regulator [Polaromonas sp. SM01]MDW5443127.1 TetR/AcrR family transcriptional regulator [Polaromonas sp. SM01]